MRNKAIFEPRNPDFAATARMSFAKQNVTKAMGMSIDKVEAGEVEISLMRNDKVLQQQGFVHGGVMAMGLDNACGCAGMTFVDAGLEVLTVELKTTFIAPASQEKIIFRGHLIKPGQRIAFAESEAYGVEGDKEVLLATMSATLTFVPVND